MSLDRPFERVEIDSAINALRRFTAAGPDQIPNAFLKLLGPVAREALLVLFNRIWASGKWPQDWREAVVVPIFKKGNRADPADYRPICLTSCVSKLFERVLLDRLSAWSERLGVLAEEQAGFRAGRSTLDQLFILHEVCGQRKERKLPSFLAFLDIRRAYDRVWKAGLELRLWEAGIRGQMFDFLCSMLNSNSVRRVAINGGLSDPFEATIGLAQGAVLSPLLFCIFINGLRDALSAKGLGVKFGDRRISLLLYADDVVLIAKSPEQLQQMLDIVSDYAKRWRFRLNTKPGKSNVVPVPASKRNLARCDAANLHVSDGPLHTSKDYRYLGIEFGSPGKRAWNAYIHRVYKSACDRVNQLCYAASRGRYPLSVKSLCQLFNGYVRPSAEYAQALWGSMLNKECEKLLSAVDRLFCKKVLRFHPESRVSTAYLRAELGLLPSHLRAQRASLRLFGHLSSLGPSRLAGYVFQTRWLESQDNELHERQASVGALACGR